MVEIEEPKRERKISKAWVLVFVLTLAFVGSSVSAYWVQVGNNLYPENQNANVCIGCSNTNDSLNVSGNAYVSGNLTVSSINVTSGGSIYFAGAYFQRYNESILGNVLSGVSVDDSFGIVTNKSTSAILGAKNSNNSSTANSFTSATNSDNHGIAIVKWSPNYKFPNKGYLLNNFGRVKISTRTSNNSSNTGIHFGFFDDLIYGASGGSIGFVNITNETSVMNIYPNATTISNSLFVDNHTSINGTLTVDYVAGSNGNEAVIIRNDFKNFSGSIGQELFGYSSTGASNISYNLLDLEIDETGLDDNDLTFIKAKTIGSNGNNIDLISVCGEVDNYIVQGSPDEISKAYYNGVDVTPNVTNDSSNIALFEVNGDFLYLGGETNFTTISVALDTTAVLDLQFNFYYCNSSNEWEELLSVTDTTGGFTSTGTIDFSNPSNRGNCSMEFDGTPFSDTTNYTYIGIERTRATSPIDPVENLISVSGGSESFVLSDSLLKLNPVSSPPETCNSGLLGGMYVDSDDSSLYFCDGLSWNIIS